MFDSLSIIRNPVSEEDHVVYLLASLPDSYNTLVTVLQASKDIPKMKVTAEHWLCEEKKLMERADTSLYMCGKGYEFKAGLKR